MEDLLDHVATVLERAARSGRGPGLQLRIGNESSADIPFNQRGMILTRTSKDWSFQLSNFAPWGGESLIMDVSAKSFDGLCTAVKKELSQLIETTTPELSSAQVTSITARYTRCYLSIYEWIEEHLDDGYVLDVLGNENEIAVYDVREVRYRQAEDARKWLTTRCAFRNGVPLRDPRQNYGDNSSVPEGADLVMIDKKTGERYTPTALDLLAAQVARGAEIGGVQRLRAIRETGGPGLGG
jgi:hypothetical protein